MFVNSKGVTSSSGSASLLSPQTARHQHCCLKVMKCSRVLIGYYRHVIICFVQRQKATEWSV